MDKFRAVDINAVLTDPKWKCLFERSGEEVASVE